MQDVLIREVVFIILVTWFDSLLVNLVWNCACACLFHHTGGFTLVLHTCLVNLNCVFSFHVLCLHD
jgi:hypothetical protein